ncbi:hypothetical protein [Ponticaulis sp.]|uniref:hypothetical protein n=1 Tax=Ponticaulis sp. TaxID=2020902 RepID=UPI000B6F6983|nr:hypothetical protein [Ponticaulis sp.]MAI90370.1 hypothetical protein [Ponticaulis sp.]OUY00072.1 MAG: hypothetical protein CBB65_08010 [Hyphomonadaceae bacterium TMED5]
MRQSPDHSAGRAASLVQTGDLSAIHGFVRDEIRLISTESHRFSFGNVVRYGTRAALRAGAGTAREKAELLAELIRQTGADAEVVDIAKPGRAETAGLFFRDFEQDFDPEFSAAQMASWRDRLGEPAEGAGAVQIDDSGTEDIARQLRGLLSDDQFEDIGRGRYDDRSFGRYPVVRITQADGAVLLADPHRPEAELTAWPEDLRTYDTPAAESDLAVSVSLSATMSDSMDEPVEIARGEWQADEVAGRQLRIGFKAGVDAMQVLGSRISDLRAFTPILKVQALDGEELDPERQFTMGDTVTLEGDRITLSDDNEVLINGQPIGAGEASGLAAGVASAEMEVDASTYPDMKVRVWPRNGAGEMVEGLTAADFSLTDEGESVTHILRSRDIAPRILFLADDSLSMPREFRGDDAPEMQRLQRDVEAIAKTVHPNASVTVRQTGSTLWTELLKAADEPYNLVVYATDGDVTDAKPDEGGLAKLRAGPRTLIMDVDGELISRPNASTSAIFNELADVTNGQAVSVVEGDTSEVERVIQAFLMSDEALAPYQLTYRAAGGEAGETRTVDLALDQLASDADYLVPDVEMRGQMRKLVAVNLTVAVGGNEVTRVLFGHSGYGDVTEEDLNSLHGAMLGSHILAFEGPSPSLSTLLDDVLTAKLSIEDLDRATAEEPADVNGLVDKLEKGVDVLPGELATFLARAGKLSGDDFATAEHGLRTVLFSSHTVVNSNRYIKRVDIMPLADAAVLTPSRETLVEVAFRSSAALAMGEAAMFPNSTVSLLEGKALAPISLRRFRDAGMAPERVEEWDAFEDRISDPFSFPGALHFAAEDGSVLASWTIKKETGEVYAMLADGSGGGSAEERMMRDLQELDRIIALINLIAMMAGAAGAVSGLGGVSLGIVAAYGQRLARVYAAVSMAIILMDDRGIAPAVKLAIAGMACEVVKAISLGVFAGAGKSADTAVTIFAASENYIGMAGGSTPFSCPI